VCEEIQCDDLCDADSCIVDEAESQCILCVDGAYLFAGMCFEQCPPEASLRVEGDQTCYQQCPENYYYTDSSGYCKTS